MISVKQPVLRQLLIVLGVAVILALLILLGLSGDNLALVRSLFLHDRSNEEIKEMLAGFGWQGYVVITALSTLQVVCTFLPAEPIQVLAGITFSFPVGLLCCMIGIFFGNSLIYALQKTYGDQMRSFFVKKLKLDLKLIIRSSKATVIIFALYFLPAIPYGMICFLAASMGMSYRRYIAVTVLGALPSACIGVGLGYMALASNWVVTACLFGALLLTIGVLIWKKDALFDRLHSYAQRHRASAQNRVRPANGLLLTVLYYAVRAFLFLRGVKLKTVNKVGQPELPAIVLCNHGSFIDFIYAAALLRKQKPHFMVARLYFYHDLLRWLLHQLGAFPKSMFAIDMENAKNCLTVLGSGGLLAMMPEARLSTAGRFEDIQSTTYSFIKKAGVHVYTVKICGDYLADPKWGKGFRRGAVVEAELALLYTAEQVKALPMEQLQQGIAQRLTYDELRWLRQRPEIHYRVRNMAEGLENILSVCPVCERSYTLTTDKNTVSCEHCGYLTSMDDRYAFDTGFRFEDLSQWYDWQTQLIGQQITQNADYTLTSPVELRLRGNGSSLTRHSGCGVCTLDRDGLTYCGTRDKESVELHYPLKKIYRLLFGAGVNFELYDGSEILFFVPEEKRSAVDWYIASMILHDQTQ